MPLRRRCSGWISWGALTLQRSSQQINTVVNRKLGNQTPGLSEEGRKSASHFPRPKPPTGHGPAVRIGSS